MKLAMVEWVDSAHSSGWQLKDEIKNNSIAKHLITVGILADRKKDQVKIIQSMDHNQFDACMCIPRCAITRMRYLKVSK